MQPPPQRDAGGPPPLRPTGGRGAYRARIFGRILARTPGRSTQEEQIGAVGNTRGRGP
jgi:hypothetical protein